MLIVIVVVVVVVVCCYCSSDNWILTSKQSKICFGSALIRGHPSMTSIQRGRGQAHMDACGLGEMGQASCGRPHRKLKLESTDVIMSSSHAKKLAFFFTRISSFDGIKSGNFSAI